MKKNVYQNVIETLLKGTDHDETTVVYHQLIDHGRMVDVLIEDLLVNAERLIMYTNSFIRDLTEESGSRNPCGYPMTGTLNQDLHVRHAQYVARKDSLFTLVRLLLGDSNYKKFLELVKNG